MSLCFKKKKHWSAGEIEGFEDEMGDPLILLGYSKH